MAETCRLQHNKIGYKTVVFWRTPPLAKYLQHDEDFAPQVGRRFENTPDFGVMIGIIDVFKTQGVTEWTY